MERLFEYCSSRLFSALDDNSVLVDGDSGSSYVEYCGSRRVVFLWTTKSFLEIGKLSHPKIEYRSSQSIVVSWMKRSFLEIGNLSCPEIEYRSS